MRLWLRIVTTLVLTPLLWGLIGAYASGQLGAVLTPPLLGIGQFIELLVTGRFGDLAALCGAGASAALDALSQLPDVLAPLLPIYFGATLPVLALIVLILLPAEYSLKRLGLDLLTVFAMPVVAYFVTAAVASFVPDPPAETLSNSLWLVALYGLVFGLTIREPRRLARRPTRATARAA